MLWLARNIQNGATPAQLKHERQDCCPGVKAGRDPSSDGSDLSRLQSFGLRLRVCEFFWAVLWVLLESLFAERRLKSRVLTLMGSEAPACTSATRFTGIFCQGLAWQSVFPMRSKSPISENKGAKKVGHSPPYPFGKNPRAGITI